MTIANIAHGTKELFWKWEEERKKYLMLVHVKANDYVTIITMVKQMQTRIRIASFEARLGDWKWSGGSCCCLKLTLTERETETNDWLPCKCKSNFSIYYYLMVENW